MSKHHDSSNAQTPGSTSPRSFRPPGAVSLFGANPGLLGEIKARFRGKASHANDGSDSDTRSSPPMGKSPPGKIILDSECSLNNEDPHALPKHSSKEKLQSPLIDTDHHAPHTGLATSRRNPGSAMEERTQQRNPSRTQSMYTKKPNARLADIVRNNLATEPLSVTSTAVSPTSSQTSPSSPSSTTAKGWPLLSSLTSKRARKPRTRPPTVCLMLTVPSTPEKDEVLTYDPEQKMLGKCFDNRRTPESPS